jgi:zinc protease
VFIGQTSPSRAAPDFHALEAMGALFGGPTGSRLTMALRERRPLTYAISHYPVWRRLNDPAGTFGSSNVDAVKTDSAVAVWFGELKGLVGARPITDGELAFARAATAGGLLTRIETIDEVANRLNLVARDGLPTTYYDDYWRGINRVTVAEVSAAARRVIDPAHTAIVVVGDRKLVEGGLRALGIAPVVIVDSEGKVLP